MPHNLLHPTSLQDNYVHQLRQTIRAYSPGQIVLGEVLQNAIDAVAANTSGPKKIAIDFDFDTHCIRVRDSGPGFPNEPRLLFLGGTKKTGRTPPSLGLIGVGLKVVVFSSKSFRLRARDASTTRRLEITDAFLFDSATPPVLEIPDALPPDSEPLDAMGTELIVTFPSDGNHPVLIEFLDELFTRCLPRDATDPYLKTLRRAKDSKLFDNEFSALLASYLRRYTYAGDARNRGIGKPELAGAKIVVSYKGSAIPTNKSWVREYFGNGAIAGKFELEPKYLLAADSVAWTSAGLKKPGTLDCKLGPGGSNATRNLLALNTLVFRAPDEYEMLLRDKRNLFPAHVDIEDYRRRLFSRIKCIILTIGRIPSLDEYLPGGSRRVITANGTITSHDYELTKGRNQQYVRCFDLVVDVDAELNYGKDQLVDKHLVFLLRRFVNDAYAATIQAFTGEWVGKISDADDIEPDTFVGRPTLGLDEFTLRRQPCDENDVIALFFELCARGYLKGYKVYGLSQSDPYDARGLISTEAVPNPPEPVSDTQAKTIEFKLRLESILSDFDRQAKNPRDIHLLIAWDAGSCESPRYVLMKIEESKHSERKTAFDAVRHCLFDSSTGSEIQVLLLKPLAESIRNAGSHVPP